MAIAQLSHPIRIHKAYKGPILSQISDEEESLIMVKKLFATCISCITYLRGLFPESSYGDRHLEDLNLKILREDKSAPGSMHIIKWIRGCFDALERGYLHMAILTLYPNPKEPEKVTEIYQFKFKYTNEGITMDFDSSNTSIESGTKRGHIKKASILLLRKLYMLMQNLGPLPNDIVLTMKLHYYNAVTPDYYQPPGFKHGVNSHILLFEGEPVNLQVGVLSTGFHNMKLKVITEATRVSDLEDNLFQENSVSEVAHPALDCDEEEEGCNNQVYETPQTDVLQNIPKLPLHSWEALNAIEVLSATSHSFRESSTLCLYLLGDLEMEHRLHDCSDQVQRRNTVFGQQRSQSTRKKRKVSEPVLRIIPERK